MPAGDPFAGGTLTLHRNTGRLIYTSALGIENLYKLAIEGPGKVSHSPQRVTSTTGPDFFPRYSPDGASVAFTSYRFGQFGIWMVQSQTPQGSLLAEWGDGLPAPADWSPDGKSILTFGTGPQGMYQLYRVAVDTRKVTRLLDELSHDIYPTYSRDGQTIYFTSNRKDFHLGLYRMPSAGGPPTLITTRSIVRAVESADGQWLYFAEYPTGGISRMPLKGGEVTPVVEHIVDPGGWELAGHGIYYWAGNRSAPDLHYAEVEKRQDRVVFQPAIPAVPQLAISPDGRWLCFSLIERNSQELMLIEKWH
jgi:dipeptidyl aminopeptidase/acylaminoacyl peptidase